MKKEQRSPIYIRLSKRTLDFIDNLARAEHMTRADMIRRLLEKSLEEIFIAGSYKTW